jgi:hypothetical protein
VVVEVAIASSSLTEVVVDISDEDRDEDDE